jgi:hypothetical protein
MVGPTGDITTFDHIQSLDFSMDMEILEEGYLGQTANQFDDIYNGISGNLTAHMSNNEFWAFQEQVQFRAERRTAGPAANTQFSITTQFTLPTGELARVTIEDVHFGPVETSIGGREEYVELSVEFSASFMTRDF